MQYLCSEVGNLCVFHDLDNQYTAGATGRQGMLTPPYHLILHLSFIGVSVAVLWICILLHKCLRVWRFLIVIFHWLYLDSLHVAQWIILLILNSVFFLRITNWSNSTVKLFNCVKLNCILFTRFTKKLSS